MCKDDRSDCEHCTEKPLPSQCWENIHCPLRDCVCFAKEFRKDRLAFIPCVIFSLCWFYFECTDSVNIFLSNSKEIQTWEKRIKYLNKYDTSIHMLANSDMEWWDYSTADSFIVPWFPTCLTKKTLQCLILPRNVRFSTDKM